jgi:uncharacterized protein involved in exopolysaccharide biosynthesis
MKNLTHLNTRDYFQILWKRRWYAFGVFILVASGAAIDASLISDMYKSETRVEAESPPISQELIKPYIRITPEDRMNSIREQLTSRIFLERTIEQSQMYGYGTRPGFVFENAVKTAKKHIGIKMITNNTFAISFTATDPLLAHTVARQLGEELIRIGASAKKKKVLATEAFINDQIKKTKEDLVAQKKKLKQFKIAHLGEFLDQRIDKLGMLYSRLATVESLIKSAHERQKDLDFKREERKRLNLLSKDSATSPEGVKTAIDIEAIFKPEEDSIKAEIARGEKEKQKILQQIKLLQSRLNLEPSLEQELSVLMRQENDLKTQYDNLQKQKSRIDRAKTVEPDNNYEIYRIIEEASLPVNPEFPSRLHIILIGIGGGLLLGIGAAFIRELLGS